ncbi:unnamed protein product [Meloidogyne enterolobii]|uniref:Uncharacterized protein n=1 Tax=Meloidogyne enterolobii TaxID=390850 RepID=A0ACB0YW00_MELEN
MITRSKAKQQNIQNQENLTKENKRKSTRKRTIQVNQNNQQSGQNPSGSQLQFNRGSKVAKTEVLLFFNAFLIFLVNVYNFWAGYRYNRLL